MKFSRTLGGAIVGMASLFLLSTSCSKDDSGTTPTPTVPFPVSGIEIGTVDTNQVIALFNDTLARRSAGFFGIRVSFLNDSGRVLLMDTIRSTDPMGYAFLPAAEGLPLTYRFETMNTSGQLSNPADIKWASSTRIRRLGNGSPIQLTEQSIEGTAAVGNGLALLQGNTINPRIVQTNASENAAIDFAFAIANVNVQGQSVLRNIVGSPASFTGLFVTNGAYSNGNTPKAFKLRSATGVFNVTLRRQDQSLDTVPCFTFDSSYAGGSTEGAILPLEDSQAPGGFAIFGEIPEGNAVALIVKGKADRTGFVRGSAPARYIECEVLFQRFSGVPYAKTTAISFEEAQALLLQAKQNIKHNPLTVTSVVK